MLMVAGLFMSPSLVAQAADHGIKGQKAPDWDIDYWLNAEGQQAHFQLSDYRDQVTVLFCFQSWCPGCHKYGFPKLQKLVKAFEEDSNVHFLAVQTVFEGFGVNSKDKLKAMRQRYQLAIPFGHDDGRSSHKHPSNILTRYQTGGTPWFIVIDKNQKVVFNHYDFKLKAMKDWLAQLSRKPPSG